MEQVSDTMTVVQVAKRLKVSSACVYALIECGKLSAYRIGVGRGVIRVSVDQLQTFLSSAEQECVVTPPRSKDFAFLPPLS